MYLLCNVGSLALVSVLVCAEHHIYSLSHWNLDYSTKVLFLEHIPKNGNHSFPFTHIHKHTHAYLLIPICKLNYMQGPYFQSTKFEKPKITTHKELISWLTSLCFVQAAYFTFPQLYHLPFYFPVAIPIIIDNLSIHLPWMLPRCFSLCLYFNLRLDLHLNPSSVYNLIAWTTFWILAKILVNLQWNLEEKTCDNLFT